MSKVDKKKAKIQERITSLEETLRNSLGKKSSSSNEISVPKITEELNRLRKELNSI